MESGAGTGTRTVEGGNAGRSDVVAMELDVFSGEEVDSNPTPVARSRANTWHGRPKLSVKEESSAEGGPDGDLGLEGDAGADGVDALGVTEGSGVWRKGTTRRNAWGNLSYADLITKAIESASEKRMTLSQIYGWMVQNISFFKDKGESNSSAGWKNSIRHNLSLHNRFMRVQNEGTGKSSWWMINPDAKTVKVQRRRAATMDTKTYSGKRGRAQRTVSLTTTSSTTDLASKNEDFVEPRIEAAAFSSQDYRSNSTSGAGSLCGLSHMQAVEESEDVAEADFVSSSSAPMPWNSTYTAPENLDETLSESLADILVGSLSKEEMCSSENAPIAAVRQDATTLYPGASSTQCTFVTRDCPLTFPAASSHCPLFATHDNLSGKSIAAGVNSQTFAQLPTPFTGQQCAVGRVPDFGQQPDSVLRFRAPLSPADGGSRPSFGNVFGSQTSELPHMNLKRLDDILRLRAASQKPYSPGEMGIGHDVQTTGLAPSQAVGCRPLLSPRLSPGSGATQRQLNSQLLLQLLASRPQLVAKMQHLLQTRQLQQQQQQQQQHLLQQQQQQFLNPSVQAVLAQSSPSISNRSGSMLQQLLVSSSTSDTSGADAFQLNQMQLPAELRTSMPSTSAASVPAVSSPATSNFIPADLDLNFLDVDAADIDCDIDQVIKHELTFGEKLDFTFDHTTDT